MKTKLFTLLLAIVASVGMLRAEIYSGTCGEQLTWELNTEDSVLTISGSGAMEDWGDSSNVPWYLYRNNITSVTIGNSVTSIGDMAFSECSAFKKIEIPNSTTSVGRGAFDGCVNLKGVYIKNITTWCNITYHGGATINPLEYAGHLYLNGIEIIDLIIPNNVSTIKSNAFCGGRSFKSLRISESVTVIESGAFYACRGLASVVIPSSVNTIETSAFSHCDSLTSITNYAITIFIFCS